MKKSLIILLTAIMLIVMTSCNTQNPTSLPVTPENNKTTNDSKAPDVQNGTEASDTTHNKSYPQNTDNNTSGKDTSSHIPEEDIRSIVLSHAALDEQDVKYYTIHLDYDDDFRRYEYEVSFHADKYEYDYEVDALTGEILDFDKEHIFD